MYIDIIESSAFIFLPAFAALTSILTPLLAPIFRFFSSLPLMGRPRRRAFFASAGFSDNGWFGNFDPFRFCCTDLARRNKFGLRFGGLGHLLFSLGTRRCYGSFAFGRCGYRLSAFFRRRCSRCSGAGPGCGLAQLLQELFAQCVVVTGSLCSVGVVTSGA